MITRTAFAKRLKAMLDSGDPICSICPISKTPFRKSPHCEEFSARFGRTICDHYLNLEPEARSGLFFYCPCSKLKASTARALATRWLETNGFGAAFMPSLLAWLLHETINP